MSNLELLYYESKLVKPAKKPAKDRSRWITLLIVGCLLLAAIIVGSAWLKSSNGSIVPASVMDVVGEEPGFTISQGSGPYGSWWEITNTGTTPLIVRSVKLNEEYNAPVCTIYGNHITTCAVSSLPATLTIGESICLAENYIADPAAYRKMVLFVDAETSRGKFRYSPSSGIRHH
jgi:hypothetical protein